VKAFWTLPFIISIAYAQVELKVVATDHAGHPVTDLQASDLKIIDDGAPQSITSLRLDQSKTAPTVAVLLDLMDLSFQQRNAAANQLRDALGGAEASAPFHLYLLVSNGGLYPVQGIGRQLDQALRKVNGVRPLDISADRVERFKTIYSALDSMTQELARFPGPKQLLWITYGIPSSMKMVEGWVDLKPRLLQLAAQFDRGDIAVYTLDPGLILGTLNRDGLEVLSAATGGRAFSSSDLKMALKQMGTDTSATLSARLQPVAGKEDRRLIPHSASIEHSQRSTSCRPTDLSGQRDQGTAESVLTGVCSPSTSAGAGVHVRGTGAFHERPEHGFGIGRFKVRRDRLRAKCEGEFKYRRPCERAEQSI
jgi:VWFA-related protein